MYDIDKKLHQNKSSGCFRQMFKDKNGCYSLRELATVILLLAIIASWLGKQFFDKEVPEFMFYSFASLIGAGCFGYSIEKKAIIDNKN